LTPPESRVWTTLAPYILDIRINRAKQPAPD
jgi:hypothetical protein